MKNKLFGIINPLSNLSNVKKSIINSIVKFQSFSGNQRKSGNVDRF